jgi:hypothetical protein
LPAIPHALGQGHRHPFAFRPSRRHAGNETLDLVRKLSSSQRPKSFLDSQPVPNYVSAGIENTLLARLDPQVAGMQRCRNGFNAPVHVG